MTNDTDLPFLLTVQSMRWQVRMTSTDTAVSPQLDELTVNHAPIQFPTSGKAVTLPIGPPDGLYLLTWGDLTIDADIPGGTGLTVDRRGRRRSPGRRGAAGHAPAARRSRSPASPRSAASSSP